MEILTPLLLPFVNAPTIFEGLEENALFISDLFGAVLIDFDPDKNQTDIFMLMGRPMYRWPELCWRLISPGP